MAQGNFPRESVGVTAFFLGSSVTFGSASGGVSFVEMLGERLGWTAVKEAVSGTTLANLDENSYPARLRRRLPDVRPDLFVCQLSTNDAARGVPLGEPGAEEATVAGAIESVVRLARGARPTRSRRRPSPPPRRVRPAARRARRRWSRAGKRTDPAAHPAIAAAAARDRNSRPDWPASCRKLPP